MKKILLFAIPLIISGVFVSFNAEAGTGDNVFGWAWSENIGWISFNSKNCDANNDGKSDGVPVGCPLAGTSIPSYGVKLDSVTGLFSGYAWSENIGWINFAPAGPYPTSPNYPACLNLPGAGQACDGIGDYNVGGWARALAYGDGWDGWIKLRGANYGVSINKDTGDLSGYAWSDAVIGWIKFKGIEVVNYKVFVSGLFNQPPSKPSTFEVDWNRCAFKGGAVPTLSWTYSDPEGNPQSAYEIEVDDNASFNAPKFNHKVNLAATSYVLNLHDDDENPDDLPPSMQDYLLDWNSTYFWHVRVWDSFGATSTWSNPSQSKTDKHASPWVVFDWTPPEPTQGEIVEFDPDDTEVFGGAISSYLWTITQGTGNFVDSTNVSSHYPHIIFLTGANKMKLQVTDTDGFSCESDEIAITAQLPLPEYKEIPPIIWFKKIFSNFLAFVDGF